MDLAHITITPLKDRTKPTHIPTDGIQSINNALPVMDTGKVATNEMTSIRVDIDKIDHLINMVGEFVITQSMLGQFSHHHSVSDFEKLKEGIGQLDQNSR